MLVLGVDVGSARMHAAVVHRGRALPLIFPGEMPFVPSIIGVQNGRPLVGREARARVVESPSEVLFGPARYLGSSMVAIGDHIYPPEEVLAWLLNLAVNAGGGGNLDAVGLCLPPWANENARHALERAATLSGVRPVRCEYATTCAAVARSWEKAQVGLVAFVDAGAWKIEVAVAELGPSRVRVLGRAVNAMVGGTWIDSQLACAVARGIAGEDGIKLLRDRACNALLREQCELARIRLTDVESVEFGLPFVSPLLGTSEVPVARLDRALLSALAAPVFDAAVETCREALQVAGVAKTALDDVILSGGLSRMPALREHLTKDFDRGFSRATDGGSMVARGAGIAAAATVGDVILRIEDESPPPPPVTLVGAGWGHPVEISPPAASPATIPDEGELRNPCSPAEILQNRLDNDTDLSKPLCLPRLLLSIGNRRDFTGHLHLLAEEQEVVIPILQGGPCCSRHEFEMLRRQFSFKFLLYQLRPKPDLKVEQRRIPMTSLVGQGLRAILRTYTIEAMQAALGDRLQRCPRVHPDCAPLLSLLELSAVELEIATVVMDGRNTGHHIAAAFGLGVEGSLHLFLLLEAFQALVWTPAA